MQKFLRIHYVMSGKWIGDWEYHTFSVVVALRSDFFPLLCFDHCLALVHLCHLQVQWATLTVMHLDINRMRADCEYG